MKIWHGFCSTKQLNFYFGIVFDNTVKHKKFHVNKNISR